MHIGGIIFLVVVGIFVLNEFVKTLMNN